MLIKVLTEDNIFEIEKYLDQELYVGFSPDVFLESQADFHIICENEAQAAARCSVWMTHAPKGADRSAIGAIGHFEALNEQAAQAVLEKAFDILRQSGCKTAVGPMDGNTWRRYRFVTYSDGSAPFLMEPQNPPEYPVWFEKAGFVSDAQYFSKRSRLEDDFEGCEALLSDLRGQGITVKTLDISKLDSALDIIYDISADAFSDNLYYTALDRESFKKQYLAYKDYLLEQLILLAFHQDKPAGFVFLIPDYNEMKTKGRVETVIAKTIAVLPEYRKSGVGRALLRTAYRHADELGFKQAIVALVYDNNVSAKLIDEDFNYNRKYTLYRKAL